MNNEKLVKLPKEVERIDLEKATFMEDSTSNVELPMVDEKLELVSEQYNEIASNKIPALQGQLDSIVVDTTTKFSEVESKKLDKNGILTMANMGQDVKEAMTGGSVAVVGRDAVLEENIRDEAVTESKINTVFVNKVNQNKIFYNFKNECSKNIYGTNGAIADKENLKLTIPNNNTGQNSYIQLEQQINSIALAGKTVKIYFILKYSSDMFNKGTFRLNVKSTDGTVYNVGTNNTRVMLEEGKYLHSTNFTIQSKNISLFPTYLITNTVPATKDEIIICENTFYEVIVDDLVNTNNTIIMDEKINNITSNVYNIKNEVDSKTLLYNFTNECLVESGCMNGAIRDNVLRTLTVPVGSTGKQSFFKFINNMNEKKGNKLKLYVRFNTTTSELNKDNLNIYLNITRDGQKYYSQGGVVNKIQVAENEYYFSKEYLVQDGDEIYEPFIQIDNNNVLTSETTISFVDVYYEIIPCVIDLDTKNTIILNRKIEKLRDEFSVETKDVYNGNVADKTEVIIDTNTDKVFFKYTDGYNVVVRVFGLYSGKYYQIPFTNLRTGNSLNAIVNLGDYVIDTTNYSKVKFINTNMSTSNTNLKALVYFQNGNPIIPLQKIGTLNFKNPYPVLKDEIDTSGLFNRNLLVLGMRDGKLYGLNNEKIYVSNDFGKDGFPTLIGTVNGASQVCRLLFLANGNVMAFGRNGRVFTSSDNMSTWIKVLEFTGAPTHELFGAKCYKNYVMINNYNNVLHGATKSYISEDYGITFREIFDIYTNGGYSPTNVKRHMHDCAIDPYETTLDGKPMLWTCIGDGSGNTNYFWTKDFGVTWNRVAQDGAEPNQSTQIIPMKNCVLFVSDSQLCGVTRYNRPVTGTQIGQNMSFETPYILFEGYGKGIGAIQVPIASNSAIDEKRNIAYFGFYIPATIPSNYAKDNLVNYLYATDGYNFYRVFKNATDLTGGGITGVYLDNNDLMVRVGNFDIKNLNADMWI